MTLYPQGPDNSAQDSTANQDATWAAQNDPGATDSSGDLEGGPVDPDDGPTLDAYGFQSIGPDTDYNPAVAADGTNLSSVTPHPYSIPPSCLVQTTITEPDAWTAIGDGNNGVASTSDFTYQTGSETDVTVEYSADSGAHWSADGSHTVSMTSNFSQTLASIGPEDARRALLYIQYYDTQEYFPCTRVTWIWLTAHRVVAPKGTNNPLRWGEADYLNVHNNKSSYDSIKASHPGWVIFEYPGEAAELDHGKGVSYSEGAELFGVSISCTTSLQTTTEQTWAATKSGRYSRWIWSQNGWLFDPSNRGLRTFYAYGKWK